MRGTRRLIVVAGAALLGGIGALSTSTGSGGARGAATAARAGGGVTVQVVAAENFWGSVASQLGGRHVAVTSLISTPTDDPHLFGTDAADAARLAQAQVVVENGAGYDTWMRSLLSADGSSPRIVDAAAVLHVAGSDPNPHLWYDIDRVPRVAAAITTALMKSDPQHSGDFRANLTRFDESLQPLDQTIASIRSQFHGTAVAYTERVPAYLLSAARLEDKTPSGFARAIESGMDPGPGDTLAMRQLLTRHGVAVLLNNVQTETSVTSSMRSLARQRGIPVVGVSETMPPRFATFQQWQLAQARALLDALQRSHHP